jgi:hypothetical protein
MDAREPRALIIIGSGITEKKFVLDEKGENYCAEFTDGDAIFPDIFPPSRLPSDCFAQTKMLHPDDLRIVLGKILGRLGLPHDLRGVIWLGKNTWIKMPDDMKYAYDRNEMEKLSELMQKHDKDNDTNISIANVYQATNEDEYLLSDSVGGYAARLLGLLPAQQTLDRIMNGKFFDPELDVNSLYLKGIEFGLIYGEAKLKFNWEKLALSGKKTKAGGKKGHEKAFGSETEKLAKRIAYQQSVNEILSSDPNINLTRAREKVAKKFGVSTKTIQRATSSLKK